MTEGVTALYVLAHLALLTLAAFRVYRHLLNENRWTTL